MQQSGDTKYFIVKHGLDAFEALPNFIWNTHAASTIVPGNYDRARPGDQWISFAYPSTPWALSLALSQSDSPQASPKSSNSLPPMTGVAVVLDVGRVTPARTGLLVVENHLVDRLHAFARRYNRNPS
jgi:hypothetical protein